MGNKNFGRICLALAVLFSLAAIKGAAVGFSMVLIVPALVAIALVLAGIQNMRKA